MKKDNLTLKVDNELSDNVAEVFGVSETRRKVFETIIDDQIKNGKKDGKGKVSEIMIAIAKKAKNHEELSVAMYYLGCAIASIHKNEGGDAGPSEELMKLLSQVAHLGPKGEGDDEPEIDEKGESREPVEA